MGVRGYSELRAKGAAKSEHDIQCVLAANSLTVFLGNFGMTGACSGLLEAGIAPVWCSSEVELQTSVSAGATFIGRLRV